MSEGSRLILKDKDLRLRPVKLFEDCSLALKWYQDPEVLYYSEGENVTPYTLDIIKRMYLYLNHIGELYIIGVHLEQGWYPIGDATLAKDTLPIVIGEKEYRSIGLGKRILKLLIQRARELGWQKLKVRKVFSYNQRSLKLYLSLGFIELINEDGIQDGYALEKIL